MESRRTQIVTTKSQRKRVIEWMIAQETETNSSKGIASAAVDNFPTISRVYDSQSHRNNVKKAYKWCADRNAFLNALQTPENKRLSVSSCTVTGVVAKRIAVKSFAGRGKSRHDRVEFLHEIFLGEFDRYVAAGVQLSRASLKDITLRIIHDEDSPFGPNHLDNRSNMPIVSHVTM